MRYWVCVTMNNEAKTISLYSPDLQAELLDEFELTRNFRSYASEKLAIAINNLDKVPKPKSRKEFKHFELTDLQHWEPIEIEPQKKQEFLVRLLPKLGHIFNVLTIITGAFITFMALRIATVSYNTNPNPPGTPNSPTDNDQTNNSGQSLALSILGTIFNSIVVFFLYIFSGASKVLTNVGEGIHDLFRKKSNKNNLITSTSHSSNSNTKLILLSLSTGGAIITNTIITGVRLYQEGILLTNRFLDLTPALNSNSPLFDPKTRELYFELIKWLVIVGNILTVGYCSSAFQGGFALEIIGKFTRTSNVASIGTFRQRKMFEENHNYQVLNDDDPEIIEEDLRLLPLHKRTS